MKILLASETYKHQINGVANVVIGMANTLRNQGHSVKVLSLSNHNKSYREEDDYYIGSLPAVVYPDLRFSFARKNPLLDELVEWKPDVVHIHTEFSARRWAIKIAKETGAPVVMTVHTDYAQYLFGRCYRFPLFVWIVKQWSKRKYKDAARITTPSEKLRNRAQLHCVKDSVMIIPNGIKLEQYNKPVSKEEKAELLQKYHLKDNGKVLVVVTRVSKEKNIKELISFMPALLEQDPEIQLLIVGDGPVRKKLETYTKNLSLTSSVCFTGKIPPEDVYRYYAMGDVFVSASQFEIHSMTYLEAMACGLPLICKDDLSLKGVLENGVNGYTYTTKQEYIQNVLSVLQDSDLKEKMAQNSSERSLQYSNTVMAQKMSELYRAVIREKTPADGN